MSGRPIASASSFGPIDAAEFDRLMLPLGPFESSVRLAVAVSGGADSMALMLLAARWAKGRGGEATGLTVDHGLRPEAAAESRQVEAWLAARGIPHEILRWAGPRPRANVQAEARAARYRLLEEWCRKKGVLHLLLAHQREDQAETFLLRLARGSGVDGLSAMAPISESDSVRLLRPLLAIPRVRLTATLEAAGQDWIEDPSNRDPRYSRVRLRALLPALAREGLSVERLALTAARLGRARQALEKETVQLLARAVTLDEAGYAIISREPLLGAPTEVGLRALAGVLRCIGGNTYTPRIERLNRLYREIVERGLPAARTLGGCRILRLKRRSEERVLICREPGDVEAAAPVLPGARVHWDGRFHLAASRRLPGAKGPMRLEALGEKGWTALVARQPSLRESPIPAAVRPSLPSIRDLDGLVLLPQLGYGRRGNEAVTLPKYAYRVVFRPLRPLAAGGIGVV